MTRTWTAYMAVSATVEADTREEAERLLRRKFETIDATEGDGLRLCTRVTDPHLGQPMSQGMTTPGETMRSRMANRPPWIIERVEGLWDTMPLCTETDPPGEHRFRSVDTMPDEPVTEMCRQCPAQRTRARA